MIHIDVRGADTLRFMDRLHRQMPFAEMVAVNRTAEDGNAALRRALPRAFTIRNPRMVTWLAPLQLPRPNRATKTDRRAILQTEGKALILAPFEDGAPKVARSASEPVAIPTRALRPQRADVVPRKLYPSALGLVARRDPTGRRYFALGRGAIRRSATPFRRGRRGLVIQGKERTFVLDPTFQRGISAKAAGVYQRTGPGRRDVRKLWNYRQQVRRPKILHFEETVRRTVDERWVPNMLGAFDYAVRTAR